MLEFFWELYQQGQIAELRHNRGLGIAGAEFAARETVARDFQRVDKRVDKLVLVVNAMWTLLREKAGMTEADLLKCVTELDAQDGCVDGRITKPPVRCSKCDATVCRRFNRCLFCGQQYMGGSTFDTV